MAQRRGNLAVERFKLLFVLGEEGPAATQVGERLQGAVSCLKTQAWSQSRAASGNDGGSRIEGTKRATKRDRENGDIAATDAIAENLPAAGWRGIEACGEKKQSFFPGKGVQPAETGADRVVEVQLRAAQLVLDSDQRLRQGILVRGEGQDEAWLLRVGGESDLIFGGEAGEESVCGLKMLAMNQKHGGAGLDEDENFGGSIRRGEKCNMLFDAVIEDAEILLLQAFHIIPVLIRKTEVRFNQIDGDSERRLRDRSDRRRGLLRLCESSRRRQQENRTAGREEKTSEFRTRIIE